MLVWLQAADKEPEQRDAVTSTSVHPKGRNRRACSRPCTQNTAKSKKAGRAASSATSTAAAGSDKTVTIFPDSGDVARFHLESQENVAVGRFGDSKANGRLPGQRAYQNAGQFVRVYSPSRLQLQVSFYLLKVIVKFESFGVADMGSLWKHKHHVMSPDVAT